MPHDAQKTAPPAEGNADTIFAPATPPGRSAVQIIRISGPDAGVALTSMAGGIPMAGGLPTERKMHHTLITTPEGTPLDRGLVVFFKSPHSATGEDCVEFHLHGGAALGRLMLEGLARLPHFRLALPGEFTRRAFAHGRLDLEQVEAIGDIIDADTAAQHRQAMRQLDGSLGRRTDEWRGQILTLSARLEALIDFADEALPPGLDDEIKGGLSGLRQELAAALANARGGILNRDGVSIALIGAPNAGKSTLLNLLAGDERAIVSPQAGTTRDLIEVGLDIDGRAVRLADTAGIRSTAADSGADAGINAVEEEGIRRAVERAATAAMVLVLIPADSDDPAACWRRLSSIVNEAVNAAVFGANPEDTQSTPPPATQLTTPQSTTPQSPAPQQVAPQQVAPQQVAPQQVAPLIIPIITKADLASSDSALPEWHRISAITGEGVDGLKSLINARLDDLIPPTEAALLTRLRHQHAVAAAHEALGRALGHSVATAPELMAEDLRLAATALGRITGRVDVEDLLDHIFASFCIGK